MVAALSTIWSWSLAKSAESVFPEPERLGTALRRKGRETMKDIVMPPQEPSFRDSVDLMYARAVRFMDLPPGLEEKIRVCNATYTVRFGVRLRGAIHTFTGYRSVHSEGALKDLSTAPRAQ